MHIRQFVRHVSDIPFKFKLNSMIGEHQHRLKDIGQGGLCFRGNGWISPGTGICICIPFTENPCQRSGKICWCRTLEHGQYEIGISFDQILELPALHRIDRIEIYKQHYGEACGHRLTGEDAGREMGAIA